MTGLFCFCLIISQLLGHGAAQTGSPLYICTKPGRLGRGGAARGWARPGNRQLGQHVLTLVPHGAELWEPAGQSSQGGHGPITQLAPRHPGMLQHLQAELRGERNPKKAHDVQHL